MPWSIKVSKTRKEIEAYRVSQLNCFVLTYVYPRCFQFYNSGHSVIRSKYEVENIPISSDVRQCWSPNMEETKDTKESIRTLQLTHPLSPNSVPKALPSAHSQLSSHPLSSTNAKSVLSGSLNYTRGSSNTTNLNLESHFQVTRNDITQPICTHFSTGYLDMERS